MSHHRITGVLRSLLLALAGAANGWAETVTWDGDGGDASWQNPANWSTDALPASGDDVVVDVAAEFSLISSSNVTVRSLQCSNDLMLAAGRFRVTDGNSVIQGRLSSTGNPILSASGTNTTFTVAGGVEADGLGLEAIGANLSLPGLTAYSRGAGCAQVVWQASGPTGLLDVPGLTVVTGATCAILILQAMDGGRIEMPSLIELGEGRTSILADGTTSVIEMPNLQRCTATALPVSFEARNAGVLTMPSFSGGERVDVTLKTGGVLPVATLTELGGFTVTGMAVDFPVLTNLTRGDVTVDGGAVVSAPNLRVHDGKGGCPAHTWMVRGAGSVLDLSQLAALTGPGCGWLNLQAMAGGTMLLTNLTTLPDGTLNFVADGAGSAIDLGALETCAATDLLVSFTARHGGSVSVPQLKGGPKVNVTIESGGLLPAAQLEQLSGFAVDGMALDFSALTNLVASGCGTLQIEALAAGTVILSNLTSITAGNLSLRSSDTDSVIDLSTLGGFLNSRNQSRLITTNGGTILLSDQPFVLSGVQVDVAPGTPGIAPANLAATNLILHGRPWHSYQIDKRGRVSAADPWTFFRRVPLTNDFQMVGRPLAEDVEFRVGEFVADPFALELTNLRGTGIGMVFYAPTNTFFEVQGTTNLSPPISWTMFYSGTMTNTFRVLPSEPHDRPQRFFKTNTL